MHLLQSVLSQTLIEMQASCHSGIMFFLVTIKQACSSVSGCTSGCFLVQEERWLVIANKSIFAHISIPTSYSQELGANISGEFCLTPALCSWLFASCCSKAKKHCIFSPSYDRQAPFLRCRQKTSTTRTSSASRSL